MNVIGAVTIGKLIEAHYEKDELEKEIDLNPDYFSGRW